MICVYAADCTDFSNNGLGTVSPMTCTVTETLNGEWELTLEHAIDEDGRWARLANGCILRVPVPAGVTPQIGLNKKQSSSGNNEIYKVTTNHDPLRLRSDTGTKYKILGKYKKGTEVIVLDKSNTTWYEVSCPDGKHGYMHSSYLTYVRTESGSSSGSSGSDVIEDTQLRDQPFRIYRVVPELDKVTVYARHIFYDLLDNMIKSLKPSSSDTGKSVAQKISSGCLSSHDFTFYSDLTTTAEEVEWENITPIDAILGDEGFVDKYGAELARDWFDVYLVERVGNDTDVVIREKKNLTGITYDVDETDVVTRIMPTGEDDDGEILYLPELYIDSENIDAYPHPKWYHLDVSDAKEVKSGDDKKTKNQCYKDMRQAAKDEFEKGCDLPNVTLTVDFVRCSDTEEYKQYSVLSDIFLGDGVKVIAPKIGVEVYMRMTQYTYDCLTKKYTSVTLGTAADTLEGSTISSKQLPSGSVTSAKLAINSVGAGQLQSGSVGSLQIKMAAIQTAHIQDASITSAKIAQATVDELNANALSAVTATIKKLAAESLTTDDLYAALATIATAQITTANITNANIDWANIANLSAAMADIATAKINSASITSAQIEDLSASVAKLIHAEVEVGNFTLAEVTNLLANALILKQGVADSMTITNLAVTSANLLNATIGELVLKGTDGKYYRVVVGSDGTIQTEQTTVTDSEISAGETTDGHAIVSTSANIADLSAQTVKASQAVINTIMTESLTAGKITAGEALIASATIPALYTTSIEAIGNSLTFSANEKIQSIVGELDETTLIAQDASDSASNALALAEETQEGLTTVEAAAKAAQESANTNAAGLKNLQTTVTQTQEGLSVVRTEQTNLEGRVTTIESGVHIEGSEIGIYASNSPFQNIITNTGWTITENDTPVITCAETKLSAPRVQINDALMIGGLAIRPSTDKHVRVLKYGK